MDNRKGSGIFLGVVSVATLIVAIIGATFAYFSVSVTGNSTVDVSAYEFSASMTIERVYPSVPTNGIIPINPSTALSGTGIVASKNDTNLKYAVNLPEDATHKRCIDSNNYQVCTMYKVTVFNNSGQQITLNGYMVPTNNMASEYRENATGFMNLKYQPIREPDPVTEPDYGFDFVLEGSPVLFDRDSSTHIIKTIDDGAESKAIGTITVPAATDDSHPGEASQYILIYLDDAEDQSSEMGAQFSAQVTYTSDDSSSRLTGTFNIG